MTERDDDEGLQEEIERVAGHLCALQLILREVFDSIADPYTRGPAPEESRMHAFALLMERITLIVEDGSLAHLLPNLRAAAVALRLDRTREELLDPVGAALAEVTDEMHASEDFPPLSLQAALRLRDLVAEVVKVARVGYGAGHPVLAALRRAAPYVGVSPPADAPISRNMVDSAQVDG